MAQRTYAIFVGGLSPVWVSDDLGATWSNPPSVGAPPAAQVKNITCDPYNGYNTIITSASAGIYKSTDGSNSYTPVAGTTIILNETQYINSLNVIAVGAGILRSNDGGNTFVSNSFDPVVAYGPGAIYTPQYQVSNVFFEYLASGYISIYDKLFKSFDGGANWVVLNGGNPISPGVPINDIVATGGNVTVITADGIYYSNDDGLTFTNVQPLVLTLPGDNALDKFGVNVYAFDADGIVWRSTNYGLTFTSVGTIPVGIGNFKDLFAHSSSRITFVASDSVLPSTGALYLTTDSGTTINVVENPNNRAYALDGSIETPCGECPPKTTLNSATGLCEAVISGPALCPAGYIYNPITETCDQDGDICGDTDIVIGIDNSGSVQAGEWPDLILLATGIANSLATSLTSGQTQIAILHWASTACVQEQLTSNLTDILNAINQTQQLPSVCGPIGGATNHTGALCAAHNELYNGLTARPSANKVYINITDGASVIAVLGDNCVYNSVNYAPASTSDYVVYRNLATAMKNDGLKIILSAVGSTSDINGIRTNFVYGSSTPGPLLPDAVPSLDTGGNPLYSESDFASSESQISQIVGSLCSGSEPAPGCPPGCTVLLGTDGRGYCTCIESFSVNPCCFELTDCSGLLDPIYTNTDLSEYDVVGNILQFQGSDACWQIRKLDQICEGALPVIVTEVFDTCNECLPKYFTLTSCDEETVIYAEFSTELVAVNNQVAQVLIDGLPVCFTVVESEGIPPETPIEIDVFAGPFVDCECCLPQPEPTPEPFVRTTQKPVKQFYHITDSACEIRTNVKFGNNYYKLFRTIKNGLENPCGPVDFDKLWIEKELSDYSRINPPGQCVPAPIPVEPEECPVAPTSLCTPPTNISGTGNIN
jgi:photosystem II stability/assembly factor-like uncharacterized protein